MILNWTIALSWPSTFKLMCSLSPWNYQTKQINMWKQSSHETNSCEKCEITTFYKRTPCRWNIVATYQLKLILRQFTHLFLISHFKIQVFFKTINTKLWNATQVQRLSHNRRTTDRFVIRWRGNGGGVAWKGHSAANTCAVITAQWRAANSRTLAWKHLTMLH